MKSYISVTISNMKRQINIFHLLLYLHIILYILINILILFWVVLQRLDKWLHYWDVIKLQGFITFWKVKWWFVFYIIGKLVPLLGTTGLLVQQTLTIICRFAWRQLSAAHCSLFQLSSPTPIHVCFTLGVKQTQCLLKCVLRIHFQRFEF